MAAAGELADIEFLDKTFELRDVLVEGSSESATVTLLCERSLVLIFHGIDLAVLGTSGSVDYQSEGSVPLGNIELDGIDHPIVQARFSLEDAGDAKVVTVEGTAETVEYEGCDEVARPRPFRGRLPHSKLAEGMSRTPTD